MKEIKTGIYKSKIIKLQKELTFSKNKLEERIKEIEEAIEERKEIPKYKSNIERLERVNKTAQMLMEGYNSGEIASTLGFKSSTVKRYILCLREFNPKT